MNELANDIDLVYECLQHIGIAPTRQSVAILLNALCELEKCNQSVCTDNGHNNFA